MAEKKKNLSEFTPFKINSANHIRIGIVVSEWNDHITDSLLKGARETLIEQGVAPEHILVEYFLLIQINEKGHINLTRKVL